MNISQATEQELFDHSVIHVATQGKPSLTVDRLKCSYLADDGCRCAAGWLMDDQSMAAVIGAATVTSWTALADAKVVPSEHADFIQRLQTAHDGADSRSTFLPSFLERAEAVAESYKLDPSVIYFFKDSDTLVSNHLDAVD